LSYKKTNHSYLLFPTKRDQKECISSNFKMQWHRKKDSLMPLIANYLTSNVGIKITSQ
jgi:hypothetical protein